MSSGCKKTLDFRCDVIGDGSVLLAPSGVESPEHNAHPSSRSEERRLVDKYRINCCPVCNAIAANQVWWKFPEYAGLIRKTGGKHQ